jgi:hypothetical protein
MYRTENRPLYKQAYQLLAKVKTDLGLEAFQECVAHIGRDITHVSECTRGTPEQMETAISKSHYILNKKDEFGNQDFESSRKDAFILLDEAIDENWGMKKRKYKKPTEQLFNFEGETMKQRFQSHASFQVSEQVGDNSGIKQIKPVVNVDLTVSGVDEFAVLEIIAALKTNHKPLQDLVLNLKKDEPIS